MFIAIVFPLPFLISNHFTCLNSVRVLTWYSVLQSKFLSAAFAHQRARSCEDWKQPLAKRDELPWFGLWLQSMRLPLVIMTRLHGQTLRLLCCSCRTFRGWSISFQRLSSSWLQRALQYQLLGIILLWRAGSCSIPWPGELILMLKLSHCQASYVCSVRCACWDVLWSWLGNSLSDWWLRASA